MSSRYPLTLHHPNVLGVAYTVDTKEDESRWRDAGWRVTAPFAKDPDPVSAPAPPVADRTTDATGSPADDGAGSKRKTG